ncbi:MAG TPA: hypothetical protein VIF60_23220 [Burkholderiaceae bacterium]|jgi:hypothetical protein
MGRPQSYKRIELTLVLPMLAQIHIQGLIIKVNLQCGTDCVNTGPASACQAVSDNKEIPRQFLIAQQQEIGTHGDKQRQNELSTPHCYCNSSSRGTVLT